ncbi:heterogeneous nuclear ribonucleoprotein K-like [Ditylenchus destructor]|nr:heterogeneous nuclear ribonucleoprotein K-like [Ditylenchus destructor]
MLPFRKCGLLARNALSFVSCTSNYGSLCISEADKPFRGMWAVHVRNNTLAFERGIFPSRLIPGNVRSIRSLSVSNIKYADSSEDRQAKEGIEEFKISLDVEVEDVPETVVTLKCDQTDLPACVEKICNKFAELGSPSDKPGEKAAEICLLLHIRHAQRLTGKSHKEKKEKVQNIGLQLTDVRVYNDVLPYSTEKIVHITTTLSKIVDATIKIIDIMRTQPLDCLQLLYDPASVSGPLPKKVGGLCNGDEDAMAYDEMFKTKVTVPNSLMETLEENNGIRTIRNKCPGISIRLKRPKSKEYTTMAVLGYPVHHDYALWLLREQIMQLDGGPQYLETGEFNKKEN